MEHMSQFNSTVFDFRYRFEFQMMTRFRVISYEDRRDLRRFLSPKGARCSLLSVIRGHIEKSGIAGYLLAIAIVAMQENKF